MALSASLSGLCGFSGPFRTPPLKLGIAFSFARVIWLCATLIIIVLPAVVVAALDLRRGANFAIGWGVSISACAGALGNTFLQYWKARWVHERFGIAVFRPFGFPAKSYLVRNLVMPALGCYGHLVLLSDESLVRSEPRHRDSDFNPSLLGNTPLRLTVPDDEWQVSVLSVLSRADIAVFDVSAVSENLVWEMMQSFQFLPPHRILFMANGGMDWPGFTALLHEMLADSRPDLPASLRFPAPIDYGAWLFMTWKLRVRLYRTLRNIEFLDRAAEDHGWTLAEHLRSLPRETAGACPAPSHPQSSGRRNR